MRDDPGGTLAAGAPDDPWPAALDALAAAPNHHLLLFENDRVRVLDTRIPAGDETPVHTHRWPAVQQLMSWSPFIRFDADGNVLLDSRSVEALSSPPSVLWSAALPPHSLRNVGETELHVISVEVKD